MAGSASSPRFQFGIWYYLGIEGTTQAAEEVRSPARSLPYGTMAGMITLLIAAALTWYVCASLLPWEYLGVTFFPLYDAARVTGSGTLEFILFWGTVLSAVASANGCINDAARAWFSLGRDRYLPTWFSACIRNTARPIARSCSCCRSRWPSPSSPTSTRRSPSRSCRACCNTPS